MRQGDARPRGFTLLELLMAMSIFAFLGAMVIFMMRQGMNIFTTGTTDSILLDRTETVLPNVVRDFELLALPPSNDPPRLPPDEDDLITEDIVFIPAPPVDVRLRAGPIVLKDVAEGPLKGYPCTYVAFVTDISGERSDPLLRRAGNEAGENLKELNPNQAQRADEKTQFKATGGLREVCYIALPEDELFPGLLTLYQGWRTPIGGEGSLLDPRNLSTLKDVRARCRPIAHGLLHFEALFRRVFAKSWEPTSGQVGERSPYVGTRWDSTRAIDKKFPLFRAPESLEDPSDDVFPAWVKLHITLIAPTAIGLGRGETALAQGVGSDADAIFVENTLPLTGPGPPERWLKIDGEWLRYRPGRIDIQTGKVPVDRGLRGTKKASHDDGADVYVGLSTEQVVRLLFRDRYAQEDGKGDGP